jgi:hypothetical protein
VRRRRKNPVVVEIDLAEVVFYGLVLSAAGIGGYALYVAIKNATASPTAQGVAAGIEDAGTLGPGGTQQVSTAPGTLGPGASVQAPAESTSGVS